MKTEPCCDLLENIYLCGINNNEGSSASVLLCVVICLKISTFVVSTTTLHFVKCEQIALWFAWKYLPLWYQQQQLRFIFATYFCCDLLENIYLCGINNNCWEIWWCKEELWFAWKYLPLWYQQQPPLKGVAPCCVVICLKISTFVVSTTTYPLRKRLQLMLWFAWKYLPLWYQQQRVRLYDMYESGCDLLENIYLCGINNNHRTNSSSLDLVVICLKISTFVVSTTTGVHKASRDEMLWFAWKYLPLWYQQQQRQRYQYHDAVVICLKISTFVVSTTTTNHGTHISSTLWFAWKYLPLWYQQQPHRNTIRFCLGCDLLENIYLCGINNNVSQMDTMMFALWFAWKYLPLWYQQQRNLSTYILTTSCDLLENIYLCGINNNYHAVRSADWLVVICLKISTFVVSTTTHTCFFKRS